MVFWCVGARARDHEKVYGHSQLRSPLVATKVPACGHAQAGTVDWVCGLCDANVCPP